MASERYPCEWRSFTDPVTGAPIRQWTSGPTMNHHLYFTNPSLSADGRVGYLVSYRRGYPNLFTIDTDSGELTRLTDRPDINPFSASPSPAGEALYFTARDRVMRVDARSGEEAVLASFPGCRLGVCNLNRRGDRLAVGVRHEGFGELAIVETGSGRAEIALRAPEVGHVQFCPADDDLVLFSGPAHQRIWCLRRATGRAWRVYHEAPGEWVVHETWLGGGRQVLFVSWPRALCAVAAEGGPAREIARLNAWHVGSDPAGRRVVCDTTHPDRGLLLIDPGGGGTRELCRPGASRRGSQWRHDRPAGSAGIDTSILRSAEPERDPTPRPEDPESTYGPQWSHPHPSFSPDGTQVVYTSDRDRHSHVYAVQVPA